MVTKSKTVKRKWSTQSIKDKTGKDGRQKKMLPKANSTGEKTLVKRKGPCYNKNIWTLLPEHLPLGMLCSPCKVLSGADAAQSVSYFLNKE